MRTLYKYILGTIILNMSAMSVFAQSIPGVPLISVSDDADAIGSIMIEFCDIEKEENIQKLTEKELYVELEPDVEQEMCFNLTNVSEKNYVFGVNFVDGLYNNMGNKSCDLEEMKENFGQFVTGYENEVIVMSGETVQLRPKLSMPNTSIGKYLGCLTLRSIDHVRDVPDETQDAGDVSVIVRRGVTIDVWNKGVLNTGIDVHSDIVSESKNIYYKDQDIVVQGSSYTRAGTQFGITNIGSVTEDIYVRGTLTDRFGNTKDIGEKSLILVAGKSDIVTFEHSFPRYKLRFTTDIEVTHTPDVQDVPIEYIHGASDTEVLNISGNFFLFPRWLVAVLCLLVLLYVYYRHRKTTKEEKKSIEEAYAQAGVIDKAY